MRSGHPPKLKGKWVLRKGRWLLLKSSLGSFIKHNLKHEKPLQILSQYQKLTKLQRRNTNANGRLQIVVQNPKAQRL